MKKRQIAIIPLFIASMIMLLSSIVPHHHHGKLICFTTSHEQCSQIGACREGHKSDPREKECEVKLLFQTNVIKQHHYECDCCPDLMPDQLLLLFFAGLDHSLLLFGTPKEVPFIIYLERLHPTTWNHSSAGRAPPVVIA